MWHAPTIDPKSRAVYIATGDAYTLPAPATTDAVMALHMDTGKVLWSVQDTENDAWLVGCAQQPTENCPKELGPDYDFGTSPILSTLPNGARLLLAGQKSGEVWAHDPDKQGALAWKALLVDTVGEAEILFGGAADERVAYFGLSNDIVAALDIATGQRKWTVTLPARGDRAGITAALTAIPGVVFAGGRDGMLRALSAETGQAIWTFDTQQDFKTVNGVRRAVDRWARPGPTIAGGLMFVPGGYVGLGNGSPGNVLLVFAAAVASRAAGVLVNAQRLLLFAAGVGISVRLCGPKYTGPGRIDLPGPASSRLHEPNDVPRTGTGHRTR